MEYVSSDTNIWIDFSVIQEIELPFRLPYTYIMSEDAIADELLSPPELGQELISHGLKPVEISIEEFELAQSYGEKYIKLSIYDRVALSIAKNRNITLLTGDGALRRASREEGECVIGTIGIMDRLLERELVSEAEYVECLQRLKQHNGGSVRLPSAELEARLEKHSAENYGGRG